jgi:LytS/YehU family sensor histidine kinase
MLSVSVADTGQGFLDSSGSGLGLTNIRSRLVSLYGRTAALSLALNTPRGVVLTIAVPIAHS